MIYDNDLYDVLMECANGRVLVGDGWETKWLPVRVAAKVERAEALAVVERLRSEVNPQQRRVRMVANGSTY